MDADGTEIPGGLEAMRQELAEVNQRMEQMRKEATAEVEANWQSQWKNPQMVNIKVDSRLTGNDEFRALVNRARAAQAAIVEAGG